MVTILSLCLGLSVLKSCVLRLIRDTDLHYVLIGCYILQEKNKWYCFAGHAIGRDAFLENGIIMPLSVLFDDKEDIARKRAHQAIEMISETPQGKQWLNDSGWVKTGLHLCYFHWANGVMIKTLLFCVCYNIRPKTGYWSNWWVY